MALVVLHPGLSFQIEAALKAPSVTATSQSISLHLSPSGISLCSRSVDAGPSPYSMGFQLSSNSSRALFLNRTDFDVSLATSTRQQDDLWWKAF